MMKRIVLLAAFFMASACAGEGPDAGTKRVHVDIDAVESAVDLAPVDGIRSSGQPDLDDFTLVKQAGYGVVIDIRGVDEDRGIEDEAGAVEAMGLEYVALPIEDEEAISYENALKLDALIEQYDEPVFIHCGSGNRVGALLALRRSLDGASDAEALEYGRNAGMSRLTPVVEDRLKEQAD